MSGFYKIGDFCKKAQISITTARKWERKGWIVPVVTKGGHRRYTDKDVERAKLLRLGSSRTNVIYCRGLNKEKINEQLPKLKKFAAKNGFRPSEVVVEIGSGMSYNREEFQKILEGILEGSIGRVIAYSPDRVGFFGLDLIEQIAEQCGCDIAFYSKKVGAMTDPQEILDEWMFVSGELSKIARTCGRRAGRGRGRGRAERDKEQKEEEEQKEDAQGEDAQGEDAQDEDMQGEA